MSGENAQLNYSSLAGLRLHELEALKKVKNDQLYAIARQKDVLISNIIALESEILMETIPPIPEEDWEDDCEGQD